MRGWLGRWWTVLVVLVGIVAGALGAYLRSETTGSAARAWLAVGVLGAVVSGLTVLVEEVVRGRRDLTARQSQRVAYEDTLDPLIKALAKTVTLDDRRRSAARGALVRQVLVSASVLLGRDGARVRASFFTGTGDDGPQAWASVQSTGRSGEPTTVFRRGTPSGEAVFDMLRTGEVRLCRDTAVDPPPGWDPSRRRGYRTFLAVPAVTTSPRTGKAVAYGFLTVDAPVPGDLGEDDVPLARVLSTVLAVGEVVDAAMSGGRPAPLGERPGGGP